MVSFFGLKFGGGHKKTNKQVEKPSQQWKNIDKNTLGDESSGQNYSRPQIHIDRPRTSNSARPPSLWKTPYTGPGATASMVNLAGPRKLSAGELRHHTSELNLQTRFGNHSSVTLGIPSPGGAVPSPTPAAAAPEMPRPATATATTKRPGTASSRMNEWVNPFDIQFGRDSIGSQPGTPLTINASHAAKSSLGQFEFGIGDIATSSKDIEATHSNGYPSPPHSIDNLEPSFLTDTSRHGPSALRNVNNVGPTALPSPAASDARKSVASTEGPIIKDVIAKRDTLTFHPPRRQSFNMNVNEADSATPVDQKKDIAAEIQKAEEEDTKLLTEGFAGNLSAFDFGESVRRSSLASSMGKPHNYNVSIDSSHRGVSPTDMRKPPPSSTRKDSLVDFSKPMTPAEKRRKESRGRIDSETLATIPLLPDFTASPERPKPSPLRRPSMNPLPPQLPPPSGLPPAAPVPPTPLAPRPQTASAAVGSSGFITKPGFRSHMDTNPRARIPPSGLNVPPLPTEKPTGGARSPYGPPPEEGNYMRAEGSPVPPPQMRSQSPLHSKAPPEGDFPVQKGLPRGRQPAPLESPVPPQQKTYIPYRPGATEVPSPVQTLAEKTSLEEPSLALPNWADFDRHVSAIPAPLSPFRPFDDARWDLSSSSPPQLPSPSFPSLEKSISLSSENLRRAFERYDKPLISPVMGEFARSRERSPGRRVDARKAPPRPSPVGLSSPAEDSVRSGPSTVDGFSPRFI